MPRPSLGSEFSQGRALPRVGGHRVAPVDPHAAGVHPGPAAVVLHELDQLRPARAPARHDVGGADLVLLDVGVRVEHDAQQVVGRVAGGDACVGPVVGQVSAVKMREGMLYPTLQAYVAHAAGQPRNKPVMAGASAIVEILKAAGLLEEEAGELVATFEELEEALEAEEPVSTDGALAEVRLVHDPGTSTDEPPPEVPKSQE